MDTASAATGPVAAAAAAKLPRPDPGAKPLMLDPSCPDGAAGALNDDGGPTGA